jgi:hypothetical protein
LLHFWEGRYKNLPLHTCFFREEKKGEEMEGEAEAEKKEETKGTIIVIFYNIINYCHIKNDFEIKKSRELLFGEIFLSFTYHSTQFCFLGG